MVALFIIFKTDSGNSKNLYAQCHSRPAILRYKFQRESTSIIIYIDSEILNRVQDDDDDVFRNDKIGVRVL